MRWVSVRGNGKYKIKKTIKRKKGYKFFNVFLEKFTQRLIKENYFFFNHTGDWAFAYEEKQLHSTLFPAIYKESDICFREAPVQRKRWQTASLGYLDYWVVRQNQPFLVEVKHVKKRLRSKAYLRGIGSKWRNMVKQLGSITKDEISRFKRSSGLVYKMGIVICPVELLITEERGIDDTLEEIELFAEKVYGQLHPAPDWYAIAQIKDCHLSIFENEKKDLIYFPAVLIFVYEDIVSS